jgi:hypothetical protein
VQRKKIRGGFQGIQERLEKNNKDIDVGVLKDAGSYSNGKDVATVANLNSEGTDTAPARPFIEKALKRNERAYIRLLAIISKLWASGEPGLDQTRRKLGTRCTRDVKQEAKRTQGNAQSTIKRKGRNDPLDDTGKMLDSIKYEITDA